MVWSRDVLDWLGPDESLQIDIRPVVELLRIVKVQDVPAHPDHNVLIAVARVRERGDAACLPPLHLAVGEDHRDAHGGVALLCHNEFPQGLPTISPVYLTVCWRESHVKAP